MRLNVHESSSPCDSAQKIGDFPVFCFQKFVQLFASNGVPIAAIRPGTLTGDDPARNIELPRGALTSLLYELARAWAIHYRFNDSIGTRADDGTGVDVHFKSGAHDRFDIVVGADGLHSNTRALVFGPEAQFLCYLGYCFNIFSSPNDLGLSHEVVSYADPCRMAGYTRSAIATISMPF